MFTKVLLAVDGSEHSAHAVQMVADLAESMGSEVLVFHVREVMAARGGAYEVHLDEEEIDLAADIADSLQAKGVNVRSLRESGFYGFTPRLIVEAADAFNADVIVMGSRGRSDLPGLLLGSVTHKVLHLTSVPVLVVR